mgnify:CR=1 FL=1
MRGIPVGVLIHPSQFPNAVRRDLLESLRTRRVNHKFHYDSFKQTQKWLALHEAHSPARKDKDCLAIYDHAFKSAASRINARRVHVVGLGCGGGQKDTQLLKLLKRPGRKLDYTPSDVSVAMTLVARETALKIVPHADCHPVVCDLATADNLDAAFSTRITRHAARILTFFGMIPNFEPQMILPKLASLIRREDWLLFSANLAPGFDYDAGMKRILPQYDNALTRDWLMTFLHDLGVDEGDGRLLFSVEKGALGLRRVVARFHFHRRRNADVDAQRFRFDAGDSIRLFFSYRYTAEQVKNVLARHGIGVMEQWITTSDEEGVFLCRRTR